MVDRRRTSNTFLSLLLFSPFLFPCSPVSAEPAQVTFFLVPQDLLASAGSNLTRRDFLPEGRVFLFKAGSYRPALSVPANEPVEVPVGSWYWIAEAPGFVSTASGQMILEDQSPPFEKSIVWPVVPACEISLIAPESWRGEQRLDVVSLEYSAVFPTDPRERKTFWIPAGKFLAYTVDSRGISALSGIRQCQKSETYRLPRPEPPQAGEQSLVVSAHLPDSAAVLWEELMAWVEPVSNHSQILFIRPLATTRSGSRVNFFFLDLPATERLRLQLQHPTLLTSKLDLESREGAVVELPDQTLRERTAAEVPIDYLPARHHEGEVILLSECGPKPAESVAAIDRTLCSPIGDPQNLQESLAVYTFAGLDVGQYVIDAKIDDEDVSGLSNALFFVDSSSEPIQHLPLQTLKEFHIYGNLLLDSDAVPGEVRLAPTTDGSLVEWQGPTLRFPTDDDLLYHLYYFGNFPDRFGKHLLPQNQARDKSGSRSLDELAGLYYRYHLQACHEDGSCKIYGRRSTLVGEGRLDLDLGANRLLTVEVLDQRTQEPVAGAVVSTRTKGYSFPNLHFFAGETSEQTVESRDPIWIHTDHHGVAKLRNLQQGDNGITVFADGYLPFSKLIFFSEVDKIHLQVELEAKSVATDPTATVLVFPNQQPVQRAFVVGITQNGQPDLRCAAHSDSKGQLKLRQSCARSSLSMFLLLHPDALLREFSASEVFSGTQIQVEPTRGPTVRIRLTDASSNPLPGLPLDLAFSSYTLGPELLSLAANFMPRQIPHSTDPRGEIEFSIVDSRKELPRLFQGKHHLLDLTPADFGHTLEFTIDSVD